MADYHPLDTRYKGPSTAYRGSKKTAFEKADIGQKAAQPFDKPSVPPTNQPPKAGPWGNGGPPPVPPTLAQKLIAETPPPQPNTRRRGGSGRRVLFGFIVVITVVFVSKLMSQTTGIMSIDVFDVMDEIDNGSSRNMQGQTL